jgi:methyl-accepting chemotaxis protein
MLNAFKNLSIRLKLLSSIGGVGLLLVMIGGMSIVGMNQLSGRTEFIYKTNLIPITILADLRAAMLRRSNLVTWHILAADSATMATREKSIEELDRKIEELTERYAPVIVTDSERKLFEQLKGGTPAYREARKKVLESSRNFSKDAAAEIQSTELVGKLAVLYEAVEGLIAENETQAEESYRSSHDLSTAVNWLMLLTILAAACVGSLGMWFVSKLICESLGDVLEAAHQLQSGHLTYRSTVASEDEIGKLAKAFNQMAGVLENAAAQQDQALKAQAAEITGITDAIGKAQAAIEFNLDGTILTANDNFLHCFGYRLEEITGQHHRMFCDPAYTSTGEYAAFWQKLNRGEFDAGVYRQVGKGGKEIWIQAAYNPIVDPNGNVYKVVKYATDITAEKNRNAEFEGKINAVNKAQAAIEFNLDGTIITANDNCLHCLGYRLDEIKGQHHRMFCDPAYTRSGEYVAFWQKLNRGEFDAGAYRRVGKGGKEIWIQASYNPILDANGKVYKVVEYATDITAQKQAQAEMERLVVDCQSVLGKMAGNDFTQSMTGIYEGDLEKIKISINAVVRNLTETIVSVREAVEAVTLGAAEITKSNEELSAQTSEQASALEETSASMEEMTSTVKQNADNAKEASQLAVVARDTAETGGAVTKSAVEAMAEINRSSKQIADIITVIDEIAFQTNLLALNAAVEAARAGEHGRGFAVVAAEVRNLAQRSATAAKEIKDLIKESIQRVQDGTELVNRSGKTLEDIVGSVKHVTTIIADIATASQEQASGIDQVNKAIMSMDETTQQNAALVERTTSSSQLMKSQADELLRRMEIFKTNLSEEEKADMLSVVSLREHTARSVGNAYQERVPQSERIPQFGSRSAASSATRRAVVGKGRPAAEKEFEEF